MNMIEPGDRRILHIIGQKIHEDKKYRPSAFTVSYQDGDIYLIHNTLSRMIVSLSKKEWLFLEGMRDYPILGKHFLEAGLDDLVINCFFIEDGSEDYNRYEFVISVLKTMSREEEGTKSYTILPTTGCNARCFYCYEGGMPVRIMTSETADQVADFILRTRWQSKIKLIWFGGEPLTASEIISRICRRLNEHAVPFCSKLITNAVMLKPGLLEKAVTLWHLESTQVSVDGRQEDYECRKRYINPRVHPYEEMMQAVNRLLERGIRVTLRCNYDSDNLNGLKEFFDDVKNRFGTAENLSVYLAMLFQEKSKDNCVRLYQEAQTLYDYLLKIGLNCQKEHPHKLKLNHCGADSGDKCVVIDPDGWLYHCEHLPGNKLYGSIFDPSISIRSDVRADIPVDERCKTCAFLPECTPFFKNGCPDWFAYCREFKQIETNEAFRKRIMEIRQTSLIETGDSE